ncbi:DUF2637 domain-containing protein [Streptomyces sp. NBC_01304]|uniref:DUF2637 domain-containing protein n=1 Tax=Streptomyces sp. NBC_01304 TaxID=2903818 RepID=UPI002E0E4BDC|nr:DUF2637 domain-containing protein [Streptomyces sp. NBC_01304]
MAAPLSLTRTHRILIGVVVAGAVVIAAIGFSGSYAAVRELAEKKGFGGFAPYFPIGIDAGICVLLALDLLLTWIRIPFPLLRQTAWLLTAATIAFNGAAAWPDPLGVGMHAVIPILFVVAVEAARHAVGRIADITADKHMEGVRLTRWLLSPLPTFLLWRRMKLWELRSYDEVIKLEQERLVYQARLRSRYGRAWRRKAPVESLMPLRLARYGVPLKDTAPEGLAAAGIEPAVLPPAPKQAEQMPALTAEQQPQLPPPPVHGFGGPVGPDPELQALQDSPWFASEPHSAAYDGGYDPAYDPQHIDPEQFEREQRQFEQAQQFEHEQRYEQELLQDDAFRVPSGPGRTRALNIPGPRSELVQEPAAEAAPEVPSAASALPEDMSREEAYYGAFRRYVSERGDYPNARQFGIYLLDLYAVKGQSGGPLSENTLRPYIRDFRGRYQQELDADAEHIA